MNTNGGLEANLNGNFPSGEFYLPGINQIPSSRSHFHEFQDSFANVGFGFYQNETMEDHFSRHQKLEEKQQAYFGYGIIDGQTFDTLSPSLQTCLEEISQLREIPAETRYIPEPGSSENKKIVEQSPGMLSEMLPGSTLELIRKAAAIFIQSVSGTTHIDLNTNASDYSLPLLHPYEESKCVDLLQLLLASAEKAGNQQFERASRLLTQCDYLCSRDGNPVERLIYYFSRALRRRIDRETGKVSADDLSKQEEPDMDRSMMILTPTMMVSRERMPFSELIHAVGTQEIVQNVSNSRRIHIIDLFIRTGVQWIALMHSLSSLGGCHIELKISAVTTESSKDLVERTCKRLMSFAESVNIPFSSKLIVVADMLDLKEDMFDSHKDETIAVYSEFRMRGLIPQPNRLEAIMKVVRNLKPRVMVVVEVEGRNNSLSFVNRFVEALFFFGAWFDCFDASMDRDCPHRTEIESVFGYGISNMVAAEGEERKIRHVTIDVWRKFLARYGMVDIELSESSIFQAGLVLEKFPCGDSYTLEKNKNSLLIGWKGTPLISLSVWKSRS